MDDPLRLYQNNNDEHYCIVFFADFVHVYSNRTIDNLSESHFYSISVADFVSATVLLVCFVCLKEKTCKTRKTVFYFTLKALFVLEIIKF